MTHVVTVHNTQDNSITARKGFEYPATARAAADELERMIQSARDNGEAAPWRVEVTEHPTAPFGEF